MHSASTAITTEVNTRGTVRWKAPELLKTEQHNTKAADVYAFALVCYEVGQTHNSCWKLINNIDLGPDFLPQISIL